MPKRWVVRTADTAAQKHLTEALNIPPILAQVLINRNITAPLVAEQFLRADDSSLHDPFLMKGMDKAASRVKKALELHEKIVIHGDYDVDGVSAVALLERVLKNCGGNVSHFLPNRQDGYGLSIEGLRFAKDKHAKLFLTVDCGISAFEQAAYLKSLGCDVIITDHHEIAEEGRVPEAVAVINPLQKDCGYPYKHLAGVGIAFKLSQALLGDRLSAAQEHLDLVALGTVADVVAMTGENRVLVKYGLKHLAQTQKPGLRALMDAASLRRDKECTTYTVGFVLAPRLNASGRLGSAEAALELLLSEDSGRTAELAQALDKENRNRQRIEEDILKDTLKRIDAEVDFRRDSVIVLESETWHRGVIGIVASRLAERYYRPAILIQVEQDKGRGSGRSIENFHLFEALSHCRQHLDQFGGHESACGLTIMKSNIPHFRNALNAFARTRLPQENLTPPLEIDMEIPLSALNLELLSALESLGPFGQENPRPLFCSRNLQRKGQARPLSKNGIKLWVSDGNLTCEAVGFRLDEDTMESLNSRSRLDLAYTPTLNTWQGRSSISLSIEDVL